PHQTETFHIRRVDLFERTVAGLARREAVAQPIAIRYGFRCISEQRIIDALDLSEQSLSEQRQRQGYRQEITHEPPSRKMRVYHVGCHHRDTEAQRKRTRSSSNRYGRRADRGSVCRLSGK